MHTSPFSVKKEFEQKLSLMKLEKSNLFLLSVQQVNVKAFQFKAILAFECKFRRRHSFLREVDAHYFFKENVRYPVWTCRDPIFSDFRDALIIFFDSRDPIFNSRDPIRVPKTP